MEPIRFENLYDLLAIELSREFDAVRAGIGSDPDSIGDAAEKAFSSNTFSYSLLEPITTPDGSMTLLAAGSDFGKKVSSVVSRQAKDPDYPLGPIVLTPSDPLVGHYRKMILDKMTPPLDELKSTPPPALARIFSAVKPAARAHMDATVEKGVAKSFSTAQGLMMMLQVIRSEGFTQRWRVSVESAYASMAVMGAMSELSSDENLRPSIEAVGNAALYQDLSVMLKPGLYARDTARHPLRSAQMAETIGIDKQACGLIELHHAYVSDEKDPAEAADADKKQNGALKNMPVEAKVLVVANLFMAAVNDSQKMGGDIEAIKGLNFLMGEGKVDKRAVVTLTRLYLSQKFALFFEKAMEISALCPFESTADPILWNILGERNPQKFICNYKECMHLGSQQTLVSQTIPVKFDGKVVSRIRKGEYYSCRFLTGKLADLYKEISLLNTK